MDAKAIIVSVFAFITVIQALSIHRCEYGYYSVKGESDCRKCPTCPKGSGMNRKCQRYIPYHRQEIPHCIECVDGVSFSEYESSSECDPCSEIDNNHREVFKCTKVHDRFSVCKHGYFEHGGHGMCNQQCCYCDHRSDQMVFVKKCENDNMLNDMFCAPTRADGKCDKLRISNKTR